MVIFVGAGPGAPDLITLRGMRALQKADVVIYAGSLVNPELLSFCREGCSIHNSAVMTLEQVISVIESAEAEGKTTVRLHTGDTALYSTIREQTDALEKRIYRARDQPDGNSDPYGIPYTGSCSGRNSLSLGSRYFYDRLPLCRVAASAAGGAAERGVYCGNACLYCL